MYTLFAWKLLAQEILFTGTFMLLAPEHATLRPRFVNFATTLDKLVSFQGILPRERLATSPVAQIRLLACMRLPVALQVVLPVERQRAHVA